jgi:hypothetical protein
MESRVNRRMITAVASISGSNRRSAAPAIATSMALFQAPPRGGRHECCSSWRLAPSRRGLAIHSCIFSSREPRLTPPHTFAWLHMFAAFVKPFTAPAYGPNAAPLLANHRGRSDHRSSLEKSMIEARAQARVSRGQGGMIRPCLAASSIAPHNPGPGRESRCLRHRCSEAHPMGDRSSSTRSGMRVRAIPAASADVQLQPRGNPMRRQASRRLAATACATQGKEAVRGDRPLLALCRGAGCRQ